VASPALPRIGVFHADAQHARQTALAFQEAGLLGWYATSHGLPPLSSSALLRKVRDRRSSQPSPSYPDAGLTRHLATLSRLEIAVARFGDRTASWGEQRGERRFQRAVIKLVEREPVDVLCGYDSRALEVFRWAKPRGIRCILHQTDFHPAFRNEALAEEWDRHPDFFPLDYAPVGPDRIARQDEELALADLVVVGSEFAAQILRDKGCDANKIRVVPSGYDDAAFPVSYPERSPLESRPAQMLFVGDLSPANGIAYLLEAFEMVKPERATLTLIGPLRMPQTTFARYAAFVDHVPYLPMTALVHHLIAADGFVFPCLCDGNGQGLYDAFGAGLGIIQSSHADAATVHGRNGVVLDRLSRDALAQAIDDALTPPERLSQWGRESWHMRPERSWTTYRRTIARLVVPS
jgi:glycosyltransferase involved in cell wall biosynthesis